MKIGIVTITWGTNYGNRLQNYAVQELLKGLGHTALTLHRVYDDRDTRKMRIKQLSSGLYLKQNIFQNARLNLWSREAKFAEFNRKYINFSGNVLEQDEDTIANEYDAFVCGSDQVWNPHYLGYTDHVFLSFAQPEKRIAFCASIGVDELTKEQEKGFKRNIKGMASISVRERSAQVLIKQLTGRDAVTLVDPTMLISAEQWRKIEKKPKMKLPKKYILSYFLGNYDRAAMEETAKRYSCELIDLPVLGFGSRWHTIDPAEFLWLIDNCELMCTDSFHGSVFSILFKKPFYVFERVDRDKPIGTRIENLLGVFGLEDRRLGAVTELSDRGLALPDYSLTDGVLETERLRAVEFLETAFRGVG